MGETNYVVINEDKGVWIDDTELHNLLSVEIDAPDGVPPDETLVTITFVATVDRKNVGPRRKTVPVKPPTDDVDVQVAIEKARRRLERRGQHA